jgi:hypothetical protein
MIEESLANGSIFRLVLTKLDHFEENVAIILNLLPKIIQNLIRFGKVSVSLGLQPIFPFIYLVSLSRLRPAFSCRTRDVESTLWITIIVAWNLWLVGALNAGSDG